MSDGPFVVVDLFAGAGGLSTGIARACERLGLEPGVDVELHAINHWQPAIETHAANHPWAEQYQSRIEQLHPPDIAEPGSVDLLAGGPECTHYSGARGGKPVSDQKRAPAWNVLTWIQQLRPDHLCLENVEEFRLWGPIADDGTPAKDGSIFAQWVQVLESFGYSIGYDGDGKAGYVLNAADYGDPQARKRLFILGSREDRPSRPEPTHGDADTDKPDRRPAADIIDWSDLGTSLWTRDLEHGRYTPPAANTIERIAEGIRRHCDDAFGRFADAVATLDPDRLQHLREHAVPLRDVATVADAVDEPFFVRYGGGLQLTTPETILLRQGGGGVPASSRDPSPTVQGDGAIGLATAVGRPLIKPRNGPNGGLHSNLPYPAADLPSHTITAQNGNCGHLMWPYLTPLYNGRGAQRPRTRSVTRPTPTVETKDRLALCVPELWPWGLDIHYRMLQPRELKRAQGFPEDYELVASTKRDRKKLIGNAVPVNTACEIVSSLLAAKRPSLSTFGGGLAPDPDAEVPEYVEVAGDD